jgi:hypothetical protein
MPIPSKADNNVPFLPGRSRYNYVTDRSDTWVYHRGTINGTAAVKSSTPAGDYPDPDFVGPGRFEFTGLSGGGLFVGIGDLLKPLICSAVDLTGATLTLVKKDGTPSRAFPTIFPCVIAPGEYIKATGGSVVGLLLRIEDQTIL